VIEATVEPVVEATVEPVIEATVEPVVAVTVEPVVEATVGPVIEATVEPVVAVTVEPVIEATVEPVIEATVEPEIEATVEPEIEATVEPEIEETVEPVPGTSPEKTERPGQDDQDTADTAGQNEAPADRADDEDARPEPVMEVAPEPTTSPEPVMEQTPAPVAEPVAEPINEPVAEPITEPVAEPVIEVQPEPVADPIPDPMPAPVADPVDGEQAVAPKVTVGGIMALAGRTDLHDPQTWELAGTLPGGTEVTVLAEPVQDGLGWWWVEIEGDGLQGLVPVDALTERAGAPEQVVIADPVAEPAPGGAAVAERGPVDPIRVELVGEDRETTVTAGSRVTYRFALTNEATERVQVLPTATNTQDGWGAQVLDAAGTPVMTAMTLDGGARVEIEVRVTVPAETVAGVENTTVLTTNIVD
jgi:hypothetical protein